MDLMIPGALAAGVVVALWLDGARARESATATARAFCAERGFQFLDGTAALAAIGIRWAAGRPRLRRTFSFDFTDHAGERRHAALIMLGHDVAHFLVEHQ